MSVQQLKSVGQPKNLNDNRDARPANAPKQTLIAPQTYVSWYKELPVEDAVEIPKGVPALRKGVELLVEQIAAAPDLVTALRKLQKSLIDMVEVGETKKVFLGSANHTAAPVGHDDLFLLLGREQIVYRIEFLKFSGRSVDDMGAAAYDSLGHSDCPLVDTFSIPFVRQSFENFSNKNDWLTPRFLGQTLAAAFEQKARA